jgi:hypothetical protein
MLGAEGVSKGETRAQAVRVSRVRTRQSFRVVCWGRRCGDKAIRELGRATACYPNEGSKRLKRGYRETSQFLAPWLLRRWRALAGAGGRTSACGAAEGHGGACYTGAVETDTRNVRRARCRAAGGCGQGKARQGNAMQSSRRASERASGQWEIHTRAADKDAAGAGAAAGGGAVVREGGRGEWGVAGSDRRVDGVDFGRCSTRLTASASAVITIRSRGSSAPACVAALLFCSERAESRPLAGLPRALGCIVLYCTALNCVHRAAAVLIARNVSAPVLHTSCGVRS